MLKMMQGFSGSHIGQILAIQFFLPFVAMLSHSQFIFSPSPLFPVLLGKKNSVVIHDVAYRRFKDEGSFFVRWYMRMMYWCAARFAGNIIAVSEFSKKEFIDMYHADPRKVVTIYNGPVPLVDVSKELQQSILEKFFISHPYFFYIGATRPRKNLVRMIESFARFHATHPEYTLVLGGTIDTRFLNVRQVIQRCGIEGKVIQTGFLTNEEKSALYRGAFAFLFPSLYEGFGLPVLEAQSVGVPLITSNVSSLPEVAGEGAVFVDPYSVDSIVDGMERVAMPDVRNDIIQKGYENVKRFSWETTARDLMKILES